MPNPRSSGLKVSMRRSSSQIDPRVVGNRPATQLSAVDLPQPDGPSSAMNSPRFTSSVRSFSTLSAPKLRPTPCSRSDLNDVIELSDILAPAHEQPRKQNYSLAGPKNLPAQNLLHADGRHPHAV